MLPYPYQGVPLLVIIPILIRLADIPFGQGFRLHGSRMPPIAVIILVNIHAGGGNRGGTSRRTRRRRGRGYGALGGGNSRLERAGIPVSGIQIRFTRSG